MSMSEQRFTEILEAYGANPVRWPESEQAAAKDFADNNAQLAADLTQQASPLDAMLDTVKRPQTDNSLLMARILKQAETSNTNMLPMPANDTRITALQAPPWKSLAATLLFATGIGFGVGQAAAKTTNIDQAEAFLTESAQTLSNYDAGFAWIEDLS